MHITTVQNFYLFWDLDYCEDDSQVQGRSLNENIQTMSHNIFGRYRDE